MAMKPSLFNKLKRKAWRDPNFVGPVYTRDFKPNDPIVYSEVGALPNREEQMDYIKSNPEWWNTINDIRNRQVQELGVDGARRRNEDLFFKLNYGEDGITPNEYFELRGKHIDEPPVREGFRKTPKGGLESENGIYDNTGDVIIRNRRTGEVITPNGNFGGLGVEPMRFGSDTEASYFLKDMFGEGRGWDDGWVFEKNTPTPKK